jgi:hypothetical protein
MVFYHIDTTEVTESCILALQKLEYILRPQENLTQISEYNCSSGYQKNRVDKQGLVKENLIAEHVIFDGH